MDAPGATEPTEDAHQDSLAHDPSVQQRTNDHSFRPEQPADGDEDEDDKGSGEADTEEEEEDDDDDVEEPQLKYLYLTKNLGAVYRNGDATSSFLTAGDKMVWFQKRAIHLPLLKYSLDYRNTQWKHCKLT